MSGDDFRRCGTAIEKGGSREQSAETPPEDSVQDAAPVTPGIPTSTFMLLR